jgi:hypothetical protein
MLAETRCCGRIYRQDVTNSLETRRTFDLARQNYGLVGGTLDLYTCHPLGPTEAIMRPSEMCKCLTDANVINRKGRLYHRYDSCSKREELPGRLNGRCHDVVQVRA